MPPFRSRAQVFRMTRAGLLLAALLALPRAGGGQALDPVVYSISFPFLSEQVTSVEAEFPVGSRDQVEVMMPIWSPGYYRVEDYAAQVRRLSAATLDGTPLEVARTAPNRWRVITGGAARITLSYELVCVRHFVTANWVSPELGVLNGPATFLTIVGDSDRPAEVRVEPPPSWPDVATGLAPSSDGHPRHFRADDYDELVDAPIVGGTLERHTFFVQGVPHTLVDVGAPEGWNGRETAHHLRRVVEQSLPLWGELPYERYLFLNVFRQGGGGLEHGNSTLLTTNAARVGTPRGYASWLSFAAHEYVHAFNVKRLRPVELGPFDYEGPPRTPSLWLSEGVTSYLADLFVARAGLFDSDGFLDALNSAIGQLQTSPGRLLQTVEQSSLEVWGNSNSGVAPDSSTVSYYVKGQVLGFLLDARVRKLTNGRRSLIDVMRLAYQRYGGERGFTPEEFRATAEEVAGTGLQEWFRSSLASTEELDYREALDWWGLRFTEDGSWRLEARDDATPAQRERIRTLLGSGA